MSEQHDEAGALGHQLERLRLVTDELQVAVAAQRVEGAAGEQWLARLSSLEGRLDEHLARTDDRERAVATALDALTTQLNQFTAALAGEVRRTGEEAVAASTSALEDTSRHLAELTTQAVDQTVRDALTEDRANTMGPVLDRLGVIDAVRSDVVAMRESLDQRITELADRANPLDPTEALEDVSLQLVEVRHALNRTSVATLLDAIREDLDVLRSDLRAGPGDDTTNGVRDDLAGIVARVDELRLRPDPAAALGPSLQAVRDELGTLGRGIAELPDALAALRADLAAPAAVPAAGDDDALAAQVDALGRLVQHVVRSLHLIEAATVGISPQSERDRAAAMAASRDLESARRRD